MNHDPRAEADRLRAKLEMVVHYLEMLDLHYRALGAGFTPPGWGGMTVHQMIARLKEPQPPDDDDRSTSGPGA
ncbi:MAG: hypothetical protein IT432_04975 [Phycisphaerales bacterium]|nr:hypothetical protein [Phycisphaerales bacterium]